jgi:hypothetical protein
VNANASRLDKHSLVNAHAVNNEDRGILTNENVLCEPTVVVVISVVLDKTVNAKTCAEVRKLGITAAVVAFSAKKNRGNYLIANLDGIALCIDSNALADSYDLTCTLVAKNDLLVSKGIVTVLVNVSSADSAALNLYKNLTGTGSGDLDVAKFNDSLALDTVNDFRLYEISYF